MLSSNVVSYDRNSKLGMVTVKILVNGLELFVAGYILTVWLSSF